MGNALKGLLAWGVIALVIILGSLCAPSAKPKPGRGHGPPTPTPTATPPPTPSPSATPTPLPPPPSVTLAWDDETLLDPSVQGYHLWMGFSSGSETEGPNLGLVTQTSVQLTSGTTYYFFVTSYNANGESPPSNEVTYTAP
jgi:hypothetical protein